MKLPKRIDPDRIKDAIIEVRFTTKLPFEVYLGLLYQSLDDTFKYTSRPIGPKNLQFALPSEGSREIKFSLNSSSSLFYNEHIKFEIQPNSIIFNCFSKYLTWDIYQPQIHNVLTQIWKANVIESFTRVGIRYISEYPDTEIKSITKFSFSFGMPNINSDNYSFRTEFKNSDCRIILNLASRIPVVINMPSSAEQKGTLSTIDVDVIRENLEEKSLDSLLLVINQVHITEKEMFFKLLDEKFLASLNPVY